MARVSQSQLSRAVGGDQNLLALVDKQGTNDLSSQPCQQYIQDILAEGYSEVNSYAYLAADAGDASLETAPLLVRYEMQIDAYLVWLRGADGGLAMPPSIEAD